MCVHIDEELRKTAYQTLQNIITECLNWRVDVINCYVNFLSFKIQVCKLLMGGILFKI